jgi:type VI protein secretion system component VasK
VDGEIAGPIFGGVMILLVVAVSISVIYHLVVIVARRLSASRAHDESYRHLAEQATEAQQKTAEELADLRQRVARIERVLKEVE